MTAPGSSQDSHTTEGAKLSEEAVQRLSLTHRPALLRYVRRLLGGDLHQAEDIVQETFLRAWLTAADQPAGWEPCRTWLFTVARHLVIDGSRRERERPAEPDQGMLETEPASDDAMGRALQRRFLVQALSRLPATHREILVYTYLLDRSAPETAVVLGIPKGTVKSRLHQAMRRLRREQGLEAVAA